MSLSQPHDTIVPNVGTDPGDHQHPHQSAPKETSWGESDFVDGSRPIFSKYLEMAEEEDKKMTERWKADADGILVFTGLFSAVVASLLSVSIQDLRQNPQDTSNFYLANIYQLLADPNRTNISTSLLTSPPPFSPPSFAVWVNGLWFMSLIISITCAVLATLLQQWARRYLKVTQPETRFGLHKRAWIRSFFHKGVEDSLLPLVVGALPMLLHVSLVLFFAGLAVFLRNVNLTIFKVAMSWIGVCTALYGYAMLIFMLRRGSPYYAPLTPLALLLVLLPIYAIELALVIPGVCFIVLVMCWAYFGRRETDIFSKLMDWLYHLMSPAFLTPTEAALKSSLDLDTHALMWTFDHLDEDQELARFFSGLPGFHTSKAVKQSLRGIKGGKKLKLLTAIIGFLDRTFSSDLISDRVKQWRADICEEVIDLLYTPEAFLEILRKLASKDEHYREPDLRPVESTEIVQVESTEIVQFVRRWGDRKGEDTTTPVIRTLFSIAVARVQRHDDSWFVLASDEMAIPEAVLQSHAAHGDSLSLVILIHIIRQQFTYLRTPSWPFRDITHVLESASKFDVRDTSPELQHEFCALWNQMVLTAQNDSDQRIAWRILDSLRGVYIALHQGTDSLPPNFSAPIPDHWFFPLPGGHPLYPVCNDPSHMIDESAPPTFPRTVQQHDDTLAIASLTSPDAPSSSIAAPPDADEYLTAVPPLDNLHHTHQSVDTIPISLTSPDPFNASAIQDIVTSGIAASYYPTPETSTSPAPRSSSASPPTGISLQNKEESLTRSDSPYLPSPASGPVLDNILLTEFLRPLTATSALSGTSLVQTSNLGTPAEDDGNPTSKENDALDPPSAHHATDTNTIPTPAPPPEPPSLLSVTDSDAAIVGRSNAEPTGCHPPDPSHNQYDIV